jgi:hypothetical protein
MNNFRAGLLVSMSAALAGAACGSSSSTSTAPATVPRCGVTVSATELSVPASGGSGTVAITTARECAWTANSTAAWLTIRGASSGQGDGSVEYVASVNADPTTRRGVIELNDQRANVTQASADCVMQLGESSASFSPTGGSGTIAVRASSAMCTWTAASDSSWIVIRSGASGTGNGTVSFDVAATSGSPRTGTVLVAGLRYAVTQSQGCTYAVSPTSYAPGQGGGSTTVAVSTAAGCPWTAASNVPWATVAQGSAGSGPGTVQIVVDGTNGPTRTGGVLVAGQIVAVTQSAGCSFAVDPLSQSFSAQGGGGSATIDSAAGCAWTASSEVPWVTLTGPTSGSGHGGISFTVAALTGPARSGTITVAGAQIAVSQSAGCLFALAPQSQQVDPGGGDLAVSVTAADGCAWTAASGVTWITVTSGASGSGNGIVKLTVAASSSGSRTGTVTIAGQAFTVTQGGGCAFSIEPTSTSVPAGGGTGAVTVTTGAGCAWTATSNASWLTVTSGASGTGSGVAQFSAASTGGGPRSGTLTIAGQTSTVNQGSGCSFSIEPTSVSVPAGGEAVTVSVTTSSGCAWTATSNAPWLTVTSGASGTGSGVVQFSVASTGGGPRSGTLTIAGQTFTVNQGSGCTFSIAPTSASAPAGGGTGSVAVTAGAGCGWTATSNAPWLTVTSGANGSGNGTVQYSVSSTSGGSRSGTLTIAGQTFTVNQGGGCTFSIAPTSANAAAGGGTGSVAVTAGAGCTWTAASNAPWLTVTSGASGSGNGPVQYSVLSNPGSARSGTLTIAGQTFTVNQASGCSISISPTSASVPADGVKNNAVSVTAGAGCAWTATSNASWLTVMSGASDSGNGTVRYSADATTGPARSGTLTIGGHTFAVNQASGCTYQVSPLTISIGALGGSRTATVTTTAGCTWTATSNVNWITVTGGATGNGNGSATFTIAPNLVGSRSGTVTVAGQTVTVNQAGIVAPDPEFSAARAQQFGPASGHPEHAHQTREGATRTPREQTSSALLGKDTNQY